MMRTSTKMNADANRWGWRAGVAGTVAALLCGGCESLMDDSLSYPAYRDPYDVSAPGQVATGGGTADAGGPVYQDETLTMTEDERAAALAEGVSPVEESNAVVRIRSESDFYEPLEPYGHWVYVAPYGRCWYPMGVDHAWRPYWHGYWTYSDCGWYWRSYESWGWATYHYGRWMWTREYGWVWIPMTTWGPSWCHWRQYDGYVGWAPMGPYYYDDYYNGYYGGAYYGYHDYYCYAPYHKFTQPVTTNTVVVTNTVSSTQSSPTSTKPPTRAKIEQAVGRAVERLTSYALRVQEEGTFAQRHPALAAYLSQRDHQGAFAAAAALRDEAPPRPIDRDSTPAPRPVTRAADAVNRRASATADDQDSNARQAAANRTPESVRVREALAKPATSDRSVIFDTARDRSSVDSLRGRPKTDAVRERSRVDVTPARESVNRRTVEEPRVIIPQVRESRPVIIRQSNDERDRDRDSSRGNRRN